MLRVNKGGSMIRRAWRMKFVLGMRSSRLASEIDVYSTLRGAVRDIDPQSGSTQAGVRPGLGHLLSRRDA